MAIRYHIKDDGTPGRCSAASPESCPKTQAGDSFHGTLAEATVESERRFEAKHGKAPAANREEINFSKLEATKVFSDSHTMSPQPLDLSQVAPSQLYYDSRGNVYLVESCSKGSFATMNPVNEKGAPEGEPGNGSVRVEQKDAGKFRKLERKADPRYTDSVGGHSESKAVKEMPRTGHLDRAVSAQVSYRDENGNQKSVELIAPVGRLTDQKRIAIGRQLFAFSGKDPKRYEDASDEAKLNWANQKLMRRRDLRWTADGNGDVFYTHDFGSGGSHSDKKVLYLDI